MRIPQEFTPKLFTILQQGYSVADFRRDEAFVGRRAAGDRERHGERQRDNRNGQAGDRVAPKAAQRIAFAENRDELGRKRRQPRAMIHCSRPPALRPGRTGPKAPVSAAGPPPSP